MFAQFSPKDVWYLVADLWHPQNFPLSGLRGVKDAADQVVLVPTGRANDLPPAGLEAEAELGGVGVPRLLPQVGGLNVLPLTERVVND